MADSTCDLPLVAVTNDNCAKVDYGKQIVALLYQDSDGVAPNLTGTTAPTLSALQGFMTAEGADQLFILKNLAGAQVPDASDTTLSGNDVPYGGTILTDRLRTMTARLQYPSASTHTAVNAMNARQKPLRVWLVDDKSFIQGPYEEATLSFGAFLRGGIGGALPNYPLTLSVNSIDEAAFSPAPIPDVKKLVNA